MILMIGKLHGKLHILEEQLISHVLIHKVQYSVCVIFPILFMCENISKSSKRENCIFNIQFDAT